MGVETDRGGAELAALAGGPVLLGRLALTRGRRLLPTSAAAALLLGAAIGAVLLYGAWRLADEMVTSGFGATIRGVVGGSGGHRARSDSGNGGPGVERSVAGFAGMALAGRDARGRRACDAAAGTESGPGAGSGTGPVPAPVHRPRPGVWTEERKRPG